MNLLWAPWRMEYILGPKPDSCIFCLPPAEAGEDDARLVLKRGKHAFVVMNKFPYNNGHLMVVPYIHTCDFTSLPSETALECMELIQLCVKALNQVASPDGINLGMNLGMAAGAGVREHMHWHVVPRWNGDASFIAVTAETRVVPQYLEKTYAALRPLFEQA